MKKRLILLTVVAIVGFGVWLWFQHRHAASPPASKGPSPTVISKPTALQKEKPWVAAVLKGGAIPPKPRMFRYKEFPPKTPEAQAMWDWWLAMEKADKSFQWKMPIEFFGILLDQFDQPVSGADVVMTWTTDGGTQEKILKSNDDGKFRLSDAKGKRLSVRVFKLGYVRTKSDIQSFEYASFSEDNFHVPDANNPVIFRLQKLIAPEPLYKYLVDGKISVGGEPTLLDTATGKIGKGDISIAVSSGQGSGQQGSECTITVQGNGGAAIALSQEEFLFNAPQAGYQSTLSFPQRANGPQAALNQKLRFYVKTTAGRYAAVEMEVNVFIGEKVSEAELGAIIYYNPSGSRNLEYDSFKKLNP